MYRSRSFRGFTRKPKSLHTLTPLLNILVCLFVYTLGVSINRACWFKPRPMCQAWYQMQGGSTVLLFLFLSWKEYCAYGNARTMHLRNDPCKRTGQEGERYCSTMLKWEVVVCVPSFVQPFTLCTWKSLKVSDEVLLLSFWYQSWVKKQNFWIVSPPKQILRR